MGKCPENYKKRFRTKIRRPQSYVRCLSVPKAANRRTTQMKKKQIASIDYDGSNIKLRVTDRITAIELIGADQNAEDEELAMTLAGYVLADRIKCFSDENGCDIGNVAKQVTGGLLLTLADLLTVTNAPEDKVEFIECLANRARDSIVCLYGGDGELSLNVDGECLVSYAGDHVMKSADVVEAAVIEILARGIAMVTDVAMENGADKVEMIKRAVLHEYLWDSE